MDIIMVQDEQVGQYNCALNDEGPDFRVGSTGNVPSVHHGYIDQIRISNMARYTGSTYTIKWFKWICR